MMKKQLSKIQTSITLSLLTLAAYTPVAYGIGVVNISVAGANEAAAALTAGTEIYNPAGLVMFDHPQITASMLAARDKLSFDGTSTNTATGGQGPYTQSGSASTRANGYLPTIAAAYPLTDRVYSGFSVYSPFTGQFDFDNDSIVRYQDTEVDLTTIVVSPALAFKLNPKWSFGFALDAMRMIYRDSSQQYDSSIAPSIYQPSNDLTLNNSARDWAFGWHTGVLYQLSNKTRFGLSYTSKITEKLNGSSKLFDQNSLIQEADNFGFHYTLPAIYRLGAFHEFNNRWDGMAQIHYVTWGVENAIAAHNIPDGNGGVITRYDFPNFRNTWGAAVGAYYNIDPEWIIRGGLGVDEAANRSSSNQQLSSPNKTTETVGAGVHYQATKMVGLDLGYTHVFMGSVDMNNFNPSTNVELSGKMHNNIDAAGLQITWSFA